VQLTTAPGPVLKPISPAGRIRALATITAAMAGIFTLDYLTVGAPVQHLYYLPIILAALLFGVTGGVLSAAIAVMLYHLAKEPWLGGVSYGQLDLIQIILFFAVGLITAKLADDARKMHRLAMTDDLTGLHNLRSFEAVLATLIESGRRDGSPLSLLVLDVDRLKAMNDAYGHLTGADAVRTVGHILAESVPPDAVACRYGGDEFVVALPRCDLYRAEQIGNELCVAVHSAPSVLAGREWPAGSLSISVGVAAAVLSSSGLNAKNGERLFHAADQALYRAKAEGRNRLCSVVVVEP
jgi:diguanylate cyclase (GGDEF)-like protein